MKVVVFGAGGIIGQHMYISKPDEVDEAVYCRSQSDDRYYGVDITDNKETEKFLYEVEPDVVINLAGENRVDIVEADPKAYEAVNVTAVDTLSNWASCQDAWFIQVSTQGVFSGKNPPYGPYDKPDPITKYGQQKWDAEKWAVFNNRNTIIARVTFVLGVRPFPELGRVNPLEEMFIPKPQLQVNDRWFSPAWAPDAARQLWKLALKPVRGTYHIGQPVRMSRYDVARAAYSEMYPAAQQGHKLTAVSHDYFPGIAPRPQDTTWAKGSLYDTTFYDNVKNAYKEWKQNEPRS